MKGDKGTCFFFDKADHVWKTKFDTKKNCEARIEILLKLGVTDPTTTSYKCKECGFWHLGKIEQSKKYGK
jgi:hypothetical protein